MENNHILLKDWTLKAFTFKTSKGQLQLLISFVIDMAFIQLL